MSVTNGWLMRERRDSFNGSMKESMPIACAECGRAVDEFTAINEQWNMDHGRVRGARGEQPGEVVCALAVFPSGIHVREACASQTSSDKQAANASHRACQLRRQRLHTRCRSRPFTVVRPRPPI
jgi:hypothetical protein